MQCCSARCPNPALHTIWCPTWVDAHKGPHHFCEEHAQIFRDKNPESFFWGDEAREAFESVTVLHCDDERYINARGMCEKCGTLVFFNGKTELFRQATYVVDGKAWLVTHYVAVNLGDYSEAKRKFPTLFGSPAANKPFGF